MTDIRVMSKDDDHIALTYADDIALLVGAARPPTAFKRAEKLLEQLLGWENKYSLRFSAEKTQHMSVKGGLKPPFEINFDAMIMTASETTKYLAVIFDPRQSY